MISSVNAGTEAVRNEILKCRELTDKPFGVNIMLQAPNAGECACMVKKIEPAQDIVEDIILGAYRIIGSYCNYTM